MYKATSLILLLNIFKLTNEGKMLFVISFRSGLLQDFQNIMQIFFNKLKGEVEKNLINLLNYNVNYNIL